MVDYRGVVRSSHMRKQVASLVKQECGRNLLFDSGFVDVTDQVKGVKSIDSKMA